MSTRVYPCSQTLHGDVDVVINREGVSSEIDESHFQDVLSASEGDGSPEVLKTSSWWIIKYTLRQDSLYY